jgi:uncharacterized protein
MKKTVVIGASDNPERYAYKATVALNIHKHEVIPVGLRNGEIKGIKILKDYPPIEDVDTITLYVGPQHQKSWYDYILSLKPKRVIFNPGTENDELYHLLEKNNIEYLEACTLVMLAIDNY